MVTLYGGHRLAGVEGKQLVKVEPGDKSSVYYSGPACAVHILFPGKTFLQDSMSSTL